jgi:hypothetical protein
MSVADVDEVQLLGETALTTLTQLWRQLPRLDHEAAKKLGDQVSKARMAIERLVRISCEARSASLGDTTRLYEPLPFGSAAHQAHKTRHAGATSSPARSDSSGDHIAAHSGSGLQRKSSLLLASRGGGETPSGADLGSEATSAGSRGPRRKAAGGLTSADASPERRRSPPRRPGTAASEFISEARRIVAAEFGRGGDGDGGSSGPLDDAPSVALTVADDDPAWNELFRACARLNLPPSRLTLMLQLALRREAMWREHARALQQQGDRDAMAAVETRARCVIEVACAEDREEILAVVQAVRLDSTCATGTVSRSESVSKGGATATAADGAPGSSSRSGSAEPLAAALNAAAAAANINIDAAAADGVGAPQPARTSLLVFKNMRQRVEHDRQRADAEVRMASLEEERRGLVEEMARMSGDVTKLARDHAALSIRAASPQTVPPTQLADLIAEMAELRKQVEEQETELAALGV